MLTFFAAFAMFRLGCAAMSVLLVLLGEASDYQPLAILAARPPSCCSLGLVYCLALWQFKDELSGWVGSFSDPAIGLDIEKESCFSCRCRKVLRYNCFCGVRRVVLNSWLYLTGDYSLLILSSDFYVAPSPNRSSVFSTVFEDWSLLWGGWRTLSVGFKYGED